MKLLFVIAGFFACSLSFGQTIIGKWKPVFFNLGDVIKGDVKADTSFLSDTVDVIFKDDKDPKASKEMMVMMADIMLRKMKVTEQEFLASGDYKETNTRTNKITTGTYTFDEIKNLLIVKRESKTDKFKVSFKNKNLVLVNEMESRNGKKGDLLTEYELVQ